MEYFPVFDLANFVCPNNASSSSLQQDLDRYIDLAVGVLLWSQALHNNGQNWLRRCCPSLVLSHFCFLLNLENIVSKF